MNQELIQQMQKDVELMEHLSELNSSADLLELATRFANYSDLFYDEKRKRESEATKLKLKAQEELDIADSWKRKGDQAKEMMRIAKQRAREISELAKNY